MICNACKNQLRDGAKFCGQCGKKTEQGASPIAQKMPAHTLRILSVDAKGPDSGGDMSVEVKFSVTNKSGFDWDQLTTQTQLISDLGYIEETSDTHVEFIGEGDMQEFCVNFYGVKAKFFLLEPNKTKTVIHALACRAITQKMDEIEVPEHSFEVLKIKTLQINDTLKLISGAVWKTDPDSDKDVRVEARWLVQNLTKAPIPEVKFTADLFGKSGLDIGDAGSYEEIRPGATALISGSTYSNEKKLVGSKMSMGLRVMNTVTLGSFEHLGMELSPSDSDDENSSSSWSITSEGEHGENEDGSSSKRIYIKTEPGGRVLFGRLDDEAAEQLALAVEIKVMPEELLDLKENSKGHFRECEGVINSGDQGEIGNEGIIEFEDLGAIEIPKTESGEYEDGSYFVFLSLSKVSIEFEFTPNGDNFNLEKFAEVSAPINLPKFIKHELYGQPIFNIVTDYLYDGIPIDEYTRELVDRGYDDQISFFIVENGKPQLVYSNYNGQESWSSVDECLEGLETDSPHHNGDTVISADDFESFRVEFSQCDPINHAKRILLNDSPSDFLSALSCYVELLIEHSEHHEDFARDACEGLRSINGPYQNILAEAYRQSSGEDVGDEAAFEMVTHDDLRIYFSIKNNIDTYTFAYRYLVCISTVDHELSNDLPFEFKDDPMEFLKSKMVEAFIYLSESS